MVPDRKENTLSDVLRRRRMIREEWTLSDIRILKQLTTKNKHVCRIARSLGRSISSIRSAAAHMRFGLRPFD